jgi:hypothetical protein
MYSHVLLVAKIIPCAFIFFKSSCIEMNKTSVPNLVNQSEHLLKFCSLINPTTKSSPRKIIVKTYPQINSPTDV